MAKHDCLHLLERTRTPGAGLLGGLAVVASTLILSSCATLPRSAPPDSLGADLQVVGMPPAVRSVGLGPSEALQNDFSEALVRGGKEAQCDERDGQPILCVLVLSGGGGLGAYGAGVLNGWTASGTRPNFKIVTGVSTGALLAPFAFLGSDWDERLASAFLSIESDADILKRRGLFGILRNDAVADTTPLAQHIAKFIDADVVAAIGTEYEKGRRLYIGTTNMDTQTFTVWNLGRIAATGGPRALELIRKLMLASASVPIAMPPVMLSVTSGDQVYDEMHADGGIQAQFFVPLVAIDLPKAIKRANELGFDYTPTPRMFIIRNSKFQPVKESVDRNLVKVASRALDSMIQSMGRSDLNQIYAITRARGTDFHYTEVPEDFVWQAPSKFDGAEMQRLYDVGRQRAQGEDLWASEPPGLFARNIEKSTE